MKKTTSYRPDQNNNMLLGQSRLYVIINPNDLVRLSLSLESTLEACLKGGADIIQLRDKTSDDAALREYAARFRKLIPTGEKLFIVNDRPDIAREAGADGVHLGQDDMAIGEARTLLGDGKIIGRSTHSLLQAVDAESEGADYIGFGPIFATPTKPTYQAIGRTDIPNVAARIHLPFFVIGGIHRDNIAEITSRGATRVAIVRAAIETPNIEESLKILKNKLLPRAYVQ